MTTPILADYSDRDQVALYARLRALALSVWPDLSADPANPFNLDLGSFAFIGGTLHKYLDNLARETSPLTAAQRQNAVNWFKALGFNPTGATAAVFDETITLSAPPIGRFVLPAGTPVKTLSVTTPQAYQLLADAVIEPSADPPTVTVQVENSQNETDAAQFDGTPNQTVQLAASPYIDGSGAAHSDQGDWIQSPTGSLLDAGPTDRWFIVLTDSNQRAKFRFGNGASGACPTGLGSITYKTGGGSAGNVEAHAISVIDGSFTDQLGNAVAVTVDNPSSASTVGRDPMTLPEIKTTAPSMLAALTRSVNETDFEAHALGVEGVAAALCLTIDRDPRVLDNHGWIYVVPKIGGAPSTDMITAVMAAVTTTYPSMSTFQKHVTGPAYRSIDVHAALWFNKGVDPEETAALARAWLAYQFAILQPALLPDGTTNKNAGLRNPLVDFGYNLLLADPSPTPQALYALSTIETLLGGVAGVRKLGFADADLTLNGYHQDVALDLMEWPVLGNVDLVDGLSGAPL